MSPRRLVSLWRAGGEEEGGEVAAPVNDTNDGDAALPAPLAGRWVGEEVGCEASAKGVFDSFRGCVMRVCAFLLERISAFFTSIMLLFRLYYYPT